MRSLAFGNLLVRRTWFVAFSIFCTSAVSAQSTASATQARVDSSAASGLLVWSAMAHHAGLETRFGRRYNRDLYLTGIEWRRTIKSWPHARIAYTVNVLPAVVSTRMPTYSLERTQVFCDQCFRTQDGIVRQNFGTVYGAGLAPVGFSAMVGKANGIKVLCGASGGMVYFGERIPDPAARNLNFTADGTALVSIPLYSVGSIVVGYRFNHISNGGQSKVNPGMNSSMLNLGWGWGRLK